MALDANVAELAAQTTYLTNAINIKKATLDAQVAGAATAATAVAGSATALGTAATTLAITAASAAVAASTALTAWQNSTDSSETLPAISVNGFNGTVVASCIYDTSLDSDGGAWRKRCAATSWYNEVTTATGKWLGYRSTEAIARAIAGASTGDYFYNTTDKLFYSLNATSGVTQVYRGARKEFPEVVAITAEAGRVIIWDLTDSSVPMWMVFVSGGTNFITSTGLKDIINVNGIISVASSTSGIYRIKLINELLVCHTATGYRYLGNVSQRNSSANYVVDTSVLTIINATVNSVSATVLPNAPIDPATGLPVPTIAVGTAGGVSVIKDDGTVVNNAALPVGFVTFSSDGKLLGGLTAYSTIRAYNVATAALEEDYNSITIPSTGFGLGATNRRVVNSGRIAAIGSTGGLALLSRNPATPSAGMVAYLTNTYNSGWMNGDIRLAALADTVAETVSGTELVTNGTFDTGVSGWTQVNGTQSWDAAGRLTVSPAAAYQVVSRQNIAVSAGKTYIATIVLTNGTGVAAAAATNATSISTGNGSWPLVGGRQVAVFTATSSTLTIDLTSSGIGLTASFDNISVIECAADRSVKANPLTVVGALTKSVVNTGSQLVAYSGFSSSNYLEQPYNSQLDFGTGDFCIMGWVTCNLANSSILLHRTTAGAGGGINIYINGTTGVISGYASNSTSFVALTAATLSLPNSGFHLISLIRRAGVMYWYLDNLSGGSFANTADLTFINATTRVGNRQDTNISGGAFGIALLRASATAPTADQIAYIYETERKLFEPGAQCCIQGTSTAVTALDYDNQNDLLKVGTSWGITKFQGLKVNTSYSTTVGTVAAISSKSGYEVISGATSTSMTAPSKLIRDELNRAAEMKKQFGQELVYVDFDSIAAQTSFVLPLGMKAKFVYVASVLKRQGSTKDFTIINDGFRDTVLFTTAPGTSVWVSVACTRA